MSGQMTPTGYLSSYGEHLTLCCLCGVWVSHDWHDFDGMPHRCYRDFIPGFSFMAQPEPETTDDGISGEL